MDDYIKAGFKGVKIIKACFRDVSHRGTSYEYPQHMVCFCEEIRKTSILFGYKKCALSEAMLGLHILLTQP